MRWGIKRISNDDLRQIYRRHRTPGPGAGRHAARPRLKWNEQRGHYDYGRSTGTSFGRTVNGDGPCNKERLATRVKAHDGGQWVRDAALAYARKHQPRRKGGSEQRRHEPRRPMTNAPRGRTHRQCEAFGGLDWPLGVFVRSKQGLEHKHCGSLHASDARHALQMARDIYHPQAEGVSIWVVPSAAIAASEPDSKDSYFDPAADKIYRHPHLLQYPATSGAHVNAPVEYLL